jgi:hypothetical protein
MGGLSLSKVDRLAKARLLPFGKLGAHDMTEGIQ